jgi:hypothetical protein
MTENMTFILEAPRYDADRQRWNQPQSVRRSVMFSVISLVPHQFARLRKVRFEEQRVGAGTAHQNAVIVADSGAAWRGIREFGPSNVAGRWPPRYLIQCGTHRLGGDFGRATNSKDGGLRERRSPFTEFRFERREYV